MEQNQNKFYALDFAFYNSQGIYDLETKCQMMQKIGYSGIHFSAWDGTRWQTTAPLAQVKEKYGIEVSGIYIVLHLQFGASHPRNEGILTMLRNLEGCKTINLSIQTAGKQIDRGDEAGDEAVTEFLNEALKICEERDLEILLYPHIGFWMDRHSVAQRLCENINHSKLGIVFTGYHWYAIEAGNPMPTLQAILPYLKQVHLSGSRRSPLGFGGVATIEPLDTGECDNFAIMAILQNLGYKGTYGYLGWEEGGNPYNKLKRSYDALVEMKTLVDENPNWGLHYIS